MDSDSFLGKNIKEGTFTVQNTSEDWAPCHVVVRERCLTLFPPLKWKNLENNNSVDGVIKFFFLTKSRLN